MSFKAFAAEGFQVTFDNGYTVSVMFGAGYYCEHKYNDQIERFNNRVKVGHQHKSAEAEVAVFNRDGFVTGFPGCPENDRFRGWVTTNDVLAIMNWAAEQ